MVDSSQYNFDMPGELERYMADYAASLAADAAAHPPLALDNVGAGLSVPLTSGGVRVWATTEYDDSTGTYSKQSLYLQGDPNMPASASPAFAGGYSTDNGGGFFSGLMDQINSAVAQIAYVTTLQGVSELHQDIVPGVSLDELQPLTFNQDVHEAAIKTGAAVLIGGGALAPSDTATFATENVVYPPTELDAGIDLGSQDALSTLELEPQTFPVPDLAPAETFTLPEPLAAAEPLAAPIEAPLAAEDVAYPDAELDAVGEPVAAPEPFQAAPELDPMPEPMPAPEALPGTEAPIAPDNVAYPEPELDAAPEVELAPETAPQFPTPNVPAPLYDLAKPIATTFITRAVREAFSDGPPAPTYYTRPALAPHDASSDADWVQPTEAGIASGPVLIALAVLSIAYALWRI